MPRNSWQMSIQPTWPAGNQQGALGGVADDRGMAHCSQLPVFNIKPIEGGLRHCCTIRL